jgi:hypothetical protein
VVGTTPTSITVQWSKPREHGAEISAYSLQVDGVAIKLDNNNNNNNNGVLQTLTHTITDLIPKRKYKIRVQASNSEGDSPFSKPRQTTTGAIAPLYGARVFRQKFTVEDAIGSHACSFEASMRATNDIPLGCPLPLKVGTVNSVQSLKATDIRVGAASHTKPLTMNPATHR